MEGLWVSGEKIRCHNLSIVLKPSRGNHHATQTNPTLFIHSDLNPNVSNNQWGSFAHDQEDFIITTGDATGVGSSPTTDRNAIVIKPQDISTVATIALTGVVVSDVVMIPGKFISDPCSSALAGALFYNATDQRICFCNNAGADIQVADNISACY